MQKLKQWSLLILILLLMFPGCRGCSWTDGSQQKKLTAEEKKKQDELKLRLTVNELLVSPAQQGQAINSLKPGHWYQARQEVKANQSDEALEIGIELVDRKMEPIPIRGSSSFVQYKRDASLAKGQSKTSELLFHVPELPAELDENGLPAKPTVRLHYTQRGIGTAIAEVASPANLSPPEQYSIVVVGKEMARHSFWSGLSCVVWPSMSLEEKQKISPHRIAAVSENEINLSLPGNALMWSSTSHLIWYDADAALVGEAQQQAILDWLHWGGHIVLSGPDCLAAINNSFLTPWIPISQIETSTLNDEDAARLNQSWKVGRESDSNVAFRLPTNRQVPKITGSLTEGSRWIDGAEGLVAVRNVGNGKVVMSALPLSDDVLVRWQGLSSFINGAILLHPPRTWDSQREFEGSMTWIPEFESRNGDPELSTRFRTLTRDGKVQVLAGTRRRGRSGNPTIDPTAATIPTTGPVFESLGSSRNRTVGSWNDASPISSMALESLTAASGIDVPKIGLIIQLLAGYLLVLVPLNWFVFRLLGRVEWAWLAVPVLAVIGAGVVAKSVQLDIGFSRSESRLGCLELMADYPRGHHTNFVSLYTSLSESYQVLFPKESGVVLPAVAGLGASVSRARRERQNIFYQYADEKGTGISSLPIRSNSTGMLHSEEWVDLGGAIRKQFDWSAMTVALSNETEFDLKGIAIFGLSNDRKWLQAWLGDVESKRQAKGNLVEGDIQNRWMKQWDDIPFTKRYEAVLTPEGRSIVQGQRSEILSVGQMLDAAIQSTEFSLGKFVALGWMENDLGSLSVSPQASQQARSTMFLIHLTQGEDLPQRPDLKLPPKSSSLDESADVETK